MPDHPRQQSLGELWRCLADMKQSFPELINTLPYKTIKPIETMTTYIRM